MSKTRNWARLDFETAEEAKAAVDDIQSVVEETFEFAVFVRRLRDRSFCAQMKAFKEEFHGLWEFVEELMNHETVRINTTLELVAVIPQFTPWNCRQNEAAPEHVLMFGVGEPWLFKQFALFFWERTYPKWIYTVDEARLLREVFSLMPHLEEFKDLKFEPEKEAEK